MLIINLKRLVLTLVCLVTGLGIVSVLKLETTAQTLTNLMTQRAKLVEPNRIDTYPPQLLKLFPPEESTQSYVQSIGANLNFTLGEGGDLGTLHLFVDGVDVTPQARIANTRDSPSSNVEISYTPNFSEPASHCAEVRFQTLEGKRISHNWCFSVEPPSL